MRKKIFKIILKNKMLKKELSYFIRKALFTFDFSVNVLIVYN
jgi:hypothetical protein